ncbi:MAG: TRAP transporter substrate-binding protein [Deltaproteobacteria bacterium]
MQAKKWMVLFCLVSALGLFFAPFATAGSEKPIELSYANFFPPTHIQSKLPETWCKEVEKRSHGKVKITYYPGGTLLSAPKIFNGVVDGIADIGNSVLGYSRGMFPSMEAIDLPVGYPSGVVATKIINDFYNKFKPKPFKRVKVLYFHAHGPGILHSKRPVRTLEDIKGMKVRSYGFNAKMTSALGAVPVALPQSGVYEALQKGVADATFSPAEVLKGWKQAEVVKSTTLCYSVGYTAGFFVVMNLEKWNSLPKDVQKVIEEVNAEWVKKYGPAWDKSDQEGLAFSKSLGNEIIPLSAEESARWAAAVKPVLDDYAKGAEKKGLPGKKYVKFIKAKIKKYSK